MVELVLVGLVAGFLAGISPCILPVLPVVLVAGASPSASASPPASAGGPTSPKTTPRASLARSLSVIGGLVLSFSIIVLAGSEILSLLHLPQDALRDAGIVLLAVVGLGYLIPPLERCSNARSPGSALAARAEGPGDSYSAWRSASCTSPVPGRCWPRSQWSGRPTGSG
jgi:cytochrome c biogenesis protein CcdA